MSETNKLTVVPLPPVSEDTQVAGREFIDHQTFNRKADKDTRAFIIGIEESEATHA